jgi:hypothetical protein
MLATLVTHAIALVAGLAGGFYAHYKWGVKLAADVLKIKSL